MAVMGGTDGCPKGNARFCQDCEAGPLRQGYVLSLGTIDLRYYCDDHEPTAWDEAFEYSEANGGGYSFYTEWYDPDDDCACQVPCLREE
jgi:hypothetical protein